MKKILGFSVVCALVLVVGAFIVLHFFLGGIVKKSVNKFGPNITQTKVELQEATLSPLSGVGTMTGLTVGNPTGWSAGDVFRLAKVHINMEPFSVMKEQIVINELIIEQPEILYETKIVASNIGDLLKNIEKTMGAGESTPKTESGKPVKLIVRKLVLKDGRVSLGAGGQAVVIPLPPIDMVDIGVKEGGVTPSQLAVAIMRHITPTIVAASLDALAKSGGTTGAAAAQGAKQVGELLKGFLGDKKTEKK